MQNWTHSKGNLKHYKNKNIITNIYRIQAFDSIACGYLCLGFIDFMLKGKSLFGYKNIFPPNDYERNVKTIPNYFQKLKKFKMKKLYRVICGKYWKFENPKMLYVLEKSLALCIIFSKCQKEDETIFEEESIEILKILGLIENINQEFILKNIDKEQEIMSLKE